MRKIREIECDSIQSSCLPDPSPTTHNSTQQRHTHAHSTWSWTMMMSFGFGWRTRCRRRPARGTVAVVASRAELGLGKVGVRATARGAVVRRDRGRGRGARRGVVHGRAAQFEAAQEAPLAAAPRVRVKDVAHRKPAAHPVARLVLERPATAPRTLACRVRRHGSQRETSHPRPNRTGDRTGDRGRCMHRFARAAIGHVFLLVLCASVQAEERMRACL